MTSAHHRAAARERQAAKALGTQRVRRARFQRAPDLVPVRLPAGDRLVVEVKTRRRLPRLLTKALAQAAGYCADAIPCVVVSEFGGRALAVIDLHAFAALVGVAAPMRSEAQGSIFDVAASTIEDVVARVARRDLRR